MDFPIKHGDFPWQNVSLPEGISDISGDIWIHLITTSRLATSLELMIRSISQTTEPLRWVNSDQEKSSHVNSGLRNARIKHPGV